jgi:hypothetical protein
LRERSHPDQPVIQINEAKVSPKRQKKIRKQMNGQFNNIGNADNIINK